MNGDLFFEDNFNYQIHPKDYEGIKKYFIKKRGWVYVAKSDSTHMLKIGRTSKEPMQRAKSLSSSGVPYDYDIIFSLKFHNQYIAEQRIHLNLKKERGPKEFFNTSVEKAVYFLQQEYERQWTLLEKFFYTDMLFEDINLIEHSLK